MTDIGEPVRKGLFHPWEALRLLPGEVVKVRDAAEIESTLDAEGKLTGLPFTEEMRPFCGRKFTVFRRVDKGSIENDGIRRFHDVVMLNGVFCNGSSHSGCDRMCRLFWHEAWLRRSADIHGLEAPQLPKPEETAPSIKRTASAGVRLTCQSTELLGASEELAWSEPCQYMLDSLNYPPGKLLKLAWIMINNRARRRIGLPDQGRLIGCRELTPDGVLHLTPGEYVRIKPAQEISATLDMNGRNRGLEFMPEMTPLCGKEFRVYKRAKRIVHEKTGRIHELKNTVLLEDCTCSGMSHRGCPRDCFFLVREVWLERM